MEGFSSHASQLNAIISCILSSGAYHGRWLNTLSFLENCGARMIAACEHPLLVKEEMLKHAAEEFRHAHHLKRQIGKAFPIMADTYSLDQMLGGIKTLRYLPMLNLKACRYLKNSFFESRCLKNAAYIFVTYSIERRAMELYPLYEERLRQNGLKISVRSLLHEEEEHLDCMRKAIDAIPSGWKHASQILGIEDALCHEWLQAIRCELSTQ